MRPLLDCLGNADFERGRRRELVQTTLGVGSSDENAYRTSSQKSLDRSASTGPRPTDSGCPRTARVRGWTTNFEKREGSDRTRVDGEGADRQGGGGVLDSVSHSSLQHLIIPWLKPFLLQGIAHRASRCKTGQVIGGTRRTENTVIEYFYANILRAHRVEGL